MSFEFTTTEEGRVTLEEEMITKKQIIGEVLKIRGIIDNDEQVDISKINMIDYHVNIILLGEIKDPHNKHRGAYYKE